MLTPSDITLPGFYWYFDAIGGPACPVEVAGERKGELVIRFIGRDDEDLLADVAGSFLQALPPIG